MPEPNASVVEREEYPEGLLILRLAPDEERVLEFEPGQFVNVGLPFEAPEGVRWVRRPYSLASAPGAPPLELFLRRIEGGALTPALWALRPGDRLWVDKRWLGRFGLGPIPTSADVVAVATGTGLAPYVSMLRRDGEPRWRRFAVLHGVRTETELVYGDELQAQADARDDFAYVPVCSREPEDSPWPGPRGRVGDVLCAPDFAERSGITLDPANCHVLLCGNPDMIAEQTELLGRRGFQPHQTREPGQLHVERYWESTEPH
jgi:ferredoxin--NADP+ reductase